MGGKYDKLEIPMTRHDKLWAGYKTAASIKDYNLEAEIDACKYNIKEGESVVYERAALFLLEQELKLRRKEK